MKDFFIKYFRYRKLQFDITTIFLILLIGIFLIIMSYVYSKNKETIIEFSSSLMHQVGKEVIGQFDSLGKSIELSTEISKTAIETKDSINLQNKALLGYLRNILKLVPDLSILHAASVDGSLLVCHRAKKNDRLYNILLQNFPDLSTIDNYSYVYQWGKSNYSKEAVFLFVDENGSVVNEGSASTNFNALSRPWFVDADYKKRGIWTNIYEFIISKDLGISFGYPIYDSAGNFIAVTGSSIQIRQLSGYLYEHNIAEYGTMMLLDEDDRVIARSDDLSYNPVKISDLLKVNDSNPKFATAYTIYRNTGQEYFLFDFEDVQYIASFIPYKSFSSKNWMWGITIPASYFLHEVIETQKKLYLITIIIILIGGALVAIFSKRISRPIVDLSDNINKLTNLDLSEGKNIESSVKEIVQMKHAIESLKSALKSFICYVPKEIVRYTLYKGGAIKLGGEKKEVAIFFSDIYDFTSIAEKISTDQINAQLSEYFDHLSNIILEEKGTIDKYIGDAIMAFWGAPTPVENSSFHALRAALKCQLVLSFLNKKWNEEKKPIFITRIGIHFDEVTIGNIGTLERMNYTAMGDGVNLASRLEGINKNYQTKIIVSQSIKDEVGQQFLFRPLDLVNVKGKSKTVKIYELIGQFGGESEISPTSMQVAFVKEFEKGFEAYFNNERELALKIFLEIEKHYPEDYPTKIFLDRLRD
jgi:adenylate cyclase